MTVIVRDPIPADEGAWRTLWAAYCDFYETELPEEVTAGTWARMLFPGSPVFGRIAEWRGRSCGFTIFVLHEGTWTLRPVCYLEDLFVDRAARGRGVGGALIEDLIARASELGWSRLYWHTRKDNRTARRLYDAYAAADDFVRYRMFLD